MRTGSWMGEIKLPALICICFVITARAALVTVGFGNSPPNSWKCLSGVHTEQKPCWSAYFVASINNLYLLSLSFWSALEKNMIPKSMIAPLLCVGATHIWWRNLVPL